MAASASVPVAPPSHTEAQPTLVANIFSADEDGALEQEDAWADGTIQELDEEERDPHRVYSRIGKISKAMHKRQRRLEKAKGEVDLQKAVLEEARVELDVRTQAVDSIEADLHRLREVQKDLSTRHAQLLAEAAQQQRAPAQCPEAVAKKAQQMLWDTAASLRQVEQLGDDPRLSQAIALLGALFQDASVAASGDQSAQQPAVHPTAGQALLPAPSVAAASASNPPVPVVPQHPVICGSCWSIACRCRVVPVPNAGAAVVDIEVDQERGQKRSCVEAALPERTSGGPQCPRALPVDSVGNPARDADAADEQPSSAVKELSPSAEHAAGEAGGETQPKGACSSKQEGEADAVSGMAVDSSGPPPAQLASGQDKAGTKDSIDEEDKEQSRKSFSALVKETCSSRSYPY